MKPNPVARVELLNDPTYTPRRLLNHALERLGVETYSALAERIDFKRAHISHISNRAAPVTPYLMVALMDAIPDLSLAEIRKLAGMPRSE
jgi:hypothetical protein